MPKTNNKQGKTKFSRKSAIIFLALFISLSFFLASPNPVNASSDNLTENEENLQNRDREPVEISSGVSMKISIFSASSENISIGEDEILLKDTVIKIEKPYIKVKNISVDSSDVSTIKGAISQIGDLLSNQSGGQGGEGGATAFSVEGHVLQFKNLQFAGYNNENNDFNLGLSFENEVLALREPIISTQTAFGDFTVTYGSVTQSLEKFSLATKNEPPKDLSPENIQVVLDNLNVEMAKPSIVVDLPFLGTSYFALSDQYLSLKDITTKLEILENSLMNAEIRVDNQKMEFQNLGERERSISISAINMENKSLTVDVPKSYNRMGIGDIKLRYDSVTQFLDNFYFDIENVSSTQSFLNNSSLSLEGLKLDIENPVLTTEIPIFGLIKLQSKDLKLENMKFTTENLKVKKIGPEENIWNYVEFNKVYLHQEFPEMGKLNIGINDIVGSQENPVFIEPRIELNQPKYVGFELELDKLNIENPASSTIKNATLSFNIPKIGVTTYHLDGMMPTRTQMLTATLSLLGGIFFLSGIKKRRKRSY